MKKSKLIFHVNLYKYIHRNRKNRTDRIKDKNETIKSEIDNQSLQVSDS